MRWTFSPHRGQGWPNRPCTAMSFRKAVTFSGKSLFASAISRPVQSLIVSSVASNRRFHSGGASLCVRASGESCAACRISSEYAFPMPLSTRGSVSARLSVWFSAVSAARNESGSADKTSMPPGSSANNAASPSSTCKEARRLLPASVSTSEPLGKSKAARLCRPASLAPAGRQCSLPAIIKCSTSHRSPSIPKAIRLPTRRNSRTARHSAEAMGGCAVRSRKALASRTRSSLWPMIRASSAVR